MHKTSLISFRVNDEQKAMFHLLAILYDKPITQMLIDYVEDEFNKRQFTAKDLRKLPKDIRKKILNNMTERAIPYYNKNQIKLYIDETGDGIE